MESCPSLFLDNFNKMVTAKEDSFFPYMYLCLRHFLKNLILSQTKKSCRIWGSYSSFFMSMVGSFIVLGTCWCSLPLFPYADDSAVSSAWPFFEAFWENQHTVRLPAHLNRVC